MNIRQYYGELPTIPFETLKKCTVKQMRQICRERGICGHSFFKTRSTLLHMLSGMVCPRDVDATLVADVFGIVARSLSNRDLSALCYVSRAVKDALLIEKKKRFEERRKRAVEQPGSLAWCQKILLRWLLEQEEEFTNNTLFTVQLNRHIVLMQGPYAGEVWPRNGFAVGRPRTLEHHMSPEANKNAFYAICQLLRWGCFSSSIERQHWSAKYTVTEACRLTIVEKLKEFDE